MYDLVIRNARLIDEEKPLDIAIIGDTITKVDKRVKGDFKEEIDAEGRLTSPGFVDSHMHLDNAFLPVEEKWNSVTEIKLRAFPILAKLMRKGYTAATVEEVKNRAKKAAKTALKKGTTAIRTHIIVESPVELKLIKALLEVKKECSSWMDIQTVAEIIDFPFTTSDVGPSRLRRAMSIGADVIGGVSLTFRDPDWKKYIDIMFDVAKEFNKDIDLHTDETNDPKVLTLETLAEKTIQNGYQGRVTASHCSSLSAVSDETADRTIRKVREARINVIANPFTNLYLFGPNGKPEGITRVKELLEADVNVVYATDNTGDAFSPLGNADMLLAALFLAYQKDIGGKEPFKTIWKMGTYNAAKILKIIPNYGTDEDCRADLVILDAESPREAIMEQSTRLYVIKNGKIVVENGRLTF
jgi:cytosine deaminase